MRVLNKTTRQRRTPSKSSHVSLVSLVVWATVYTSLYVLYGIRLGQAYLWAKRTPDSELIGALQNKWSSRQLL